MEEKDDHIKRTLDKQQRLEVLVEKVR